MILCYILLVRRGCVNTYVIYLPLVKEYVYISKLANRTRGRPESSFFSIATIPRCMGGCYSFPWIEPFNLDQYLIMLSVKQGSIKDHFLILWNDSTSDWTPVCQIIGELSNRSANNDQVAEIYKVRFTCSNLRQRLLCVCVHETKRHLSFIATISFHAQIKTITSNADLQGKINLQDLPITIIFVP